VNTSQANLRAVAISPCFLKRSRLQNIRNLESPARMSLVGTAFNPLEEGAFGNADGNVLYHSRAGLAPTGLFAITCPSRRLYGLVTSLKN
jgi:hypothetical protein